MARGEWTDDDIALIRKLWADGVSTAEMGRRIGARGKNAIIGKIHRLGLPPRPSPIRLAKSGKKPPPPRINRAGKVTLTDAVRPARVLGAQLGPGDGFASRTHPGSDHVDVVESAQSSAVTVPLDGVVFRPRRSTPCCWPIGEPGTIDFYTCGDASVPGKSYCEFHHSVAHVRVAVDRREGGGITFPAPGSLRAA